MSRVNHSVTIYLATCRVIPTSQDVLSERYVPESQVRRPIIVFSRQSPEELPIASNLNQT